VKIVFALAVGIFFGTGSYLLLKRDLLRVVGGVILLSNAANLFLMAAGLSRGSAPMLPAKGPLSDPLVQSMTLTAVVITFGVAALLLSLVFRVYTSHETIDLRALSEAEEEDREKAQSEKPEREPV
jgi:multicomponent Na+:H+ antiporter subunit C